MTKLVSSEINRAGFVCLSRTVFLFPIFGFAMCTRCDKGQLLFRGVFKCVLRSLLVASIEIIWLYSNLMFYSLVSCHCAKVYHVIFCKMITISKGRSQCMVEFQSSQGVTGNMKLIFFIFFLRKKDQQFIWVDKCAPFSLLL